MFSSFVKYDKRGENKRVLKAKRSFTRAEPKNLHIYSVWTRLRRVHKIRLLEIVSIRRSMVVCFFGLSNHQVSVGKNVHYCKTTVFVTDILRYEK